jgi:DNA-binding response OmpR family regulator
MRIAIADDDKDARDFAHEVLSLPGYNCVTFGNGRDLVAQLKRETFDLLLLDWNMPGMTAIEVIEWVRQNLTDVPKMIVLTSRSHDNDVSFALDAGADDFIVKPSSAKVIQARVKAALRSSNIASPANRMVQHGRFGFDHLDQSVSFDGGSVHLTAKEFALALLLFENMQRPLSRGYILQRIWKNTVDLSTRTLDMHISKVRSKLALRPEHGFRLQTIFGYGYRLDTFDDKVSDVSGEAVPAN